MQQYLTPGMLNYFTFWVGSTVAEAATLVLRFLYCGGVVKEVEVVAGNYCSCKLQIPLWLGCNDIRNADTVQLVADDEISAEYPLTINKAEK